MCHKPDWVSCKENKFTGFLSLQFAPGNPSEILVTAADSRIRILDGSEVVQKYRGAP